MEFDKPKLSTINIYINCIFMISKKSKLYLQGSFFGFCVQLGVHILKK